MYKIVFSEDEASQLHGFSKAVSDARTDQDKKNNDKGPNRVNDKFVGALGEAAVARMLGLPMNLTVYPTGKTSIKPDFGKNVEVKTCSEKHIGTEVDSWIHDKHYRMVTNPKPEDTIVLVYANTETYEVSVIGWVKATDVVGMWKPCVSPKLHRKHAIYRIDIEHLVQPLDTLNAIL